ncbi:Uncharacterised protein [Enterobacter hormaechei]|nr:Uncharacterised protein [Enterobacter hormaechei]SAE86927.1 Uncharacterised protein [Enterobacter cloacae]CZV74216.1 Uncharacterised protein [Enterobacter hormaechei]CZW71550.1 Uncharacterised protein [Enterobacter hormaechei]CZW86227.1 Uncharacterised protein [Enterobacter hormaechei]
MLNAPPPDVSVDVCFLPLTLTLSPKGRGNYLHPLPFGERAGVRGALSVCAVVHHHTAQAGDLLQLAKRTFELIFRRIRPHEDTGNFTLYRRGG